VNFFIHSFVIVVYKIIKSEFVRIIEILQYTVKDALSQKVRINLFTLYEKCVYRVGCTVEWIGVNCIQRGNPGVGSVGRLNENPVSRHCTSQ